MIPVIKDAGVTSNDGFQQFIPETNMKHINYKTVGIVFTSLTQTNIVCTVQGRSQ